MEVDQRLLVISRTMLGTAERENVGMLRNHPKEDEPRGRRVSNVPELVASSMRMAAWVIKRWILQKVPK